MSEFMAKILEWSHSMEAIAPEVARQAIEQALFVVRLQLTLAWIAVCIGIPLLIAGIVGEMMDEWGSWFVAIILGAMMTVLGGFAMGDAYIALWRWEHVPQFMLLRTVTGS